MQSIAIAPMLEWSTRDYRYFMRQITKNAILYTEMIHANAVIHGNQDKLLAYNEIEHPIIVQLGGSNPEQLAIASKICADTFRYEGINLNVGCPSTKVCAGKFGACLMKDANLVGKCVEAIKDANPGTVVSIKHRIGLDDIEDYGFLHDFVSIVMQSGCYDFIVHARNAYLNGISPKQNREIPPLKYEYVYRLKEDFPKLNIMINGGIKTCMDVANHQKYVDGVMIGREAYYNPYVLATIEHELYGCDLIDRIEVAKNMINYLIAAYNAGISLYQITRHMIGLYYGCPNAKHWRYTLTSAMLKSNSIDTYLELLKDME